MVLSGGDSDMVEVMLSVIHCNNDDDVATTPHRHTTTHHKTKRSLTPANVPSDPCKRPRHTRLNVLLTIEKQKLLPHQTKRSLDTCKRSL